MLIVGIALAVISLFIAALPHFLAIVGKFWPDTSELHIKRTRVENPSTDDDAILAAIGFVLHHEFEKRLGEQQVVSKKS
jgi:hypothetical protein